LFFNRDAKAMTVKSLQSAAIDRVIEILESARQRTPMYIQPVNPEVLNHYLNGVRTGLACIGLEWSNTHRERALKPRRLELRSTGEEGQLAKRGLTTEQIVDELLAIEIDMWRSHREELA
jgi:hypothetical protein